VDGEVKISIPSIIPAHLKYIYTHSRHKYTQINIQSTRADNHSYIIYTNTIIEGALISLCISIYNYPTRSCPSSNKYISTIP
jgi:hypothetical protein